jgi:hypothetical protein
VCPFTEDGFINREPTVCKPSWYGDSTSFMGSGQTLQLPAAIRYKVSRSVSSTIKCTVNMWVYDIMQTICTCRQAGRRQAVLQLPNLWRQPELARKTPPPSLYNMLLCLCSMHAP